MTRPGPGVADPGPNILLSASRRRLVAESIGISLSAGAFGLVYGLACRGAGFSLVEALAMSVFVLAGSSQFAAVGLVTRLWSTGTGLTILAVGVGIYLVGAVVVFTGFIPAIRALPMPRPSYWKLRRLLMNGALHIRS